MSNARRPSPAASIDLPSRLRWPFAIAVAAALCSGCSTIDTYLPTARSFGVYKIDVNQGNYLTRDMVEKLKEGMTRGQVRAILGTPLVTSAFRADRWDYVYGFARQGRQLEERRFTVYFVGDKLARWEGDEMPESVAALNRAAIDKSLGHVPSADDPGILEWFLGIFRK